MDLRFVASGARGDETIDALSLQGDRNPPLLQQGQQVAPAPAGGPRDGGDAVLAPQRVGPVVE